MRTLNPLRALQNLTRFVFSNEYQQARLSLAEDAQKASKNLWVLFTLELASKWVPAAQLLALLGDKTPTLAQPVAGWVVVLTVTTSVVLRIVAFFLQKGQEK